MDLTIIAIIGIVTMLILLFAGMNIGLAMFIVGLFGYAYVINWPAALGVLMSNPMNTAMSYSMTVMPLFVLMGQFVYYAGLSDGLFDSMEKWFGRVRGGIAMAAVAACALFGAICGSLPAALMTMGLIAYPAMKRRAYDDKLSTSALCAGATLGCLIPPSSPLILYGIITETSIGKLFAAGTIPGIVMTITFIIVIIFMVRKNPALAPTGQAYTLKEKIISLKGCVLTVVLFVIVIGGMFNGWFSATEAAAIGAFAALVILIVKKRATWATLKRALWDTVKTSCMSMTIVLGAYMLGYFLAVTKLPMALASAVASLNVAPALVMGIIILAYAFLGCIMDGLAIMLLTTPIILPVVLQLGYDTIWFGVIMTMVMNLGAITPPVGTGAYIASGALKVPLQTVFKGLAPYIIAFAICFLIFVLWPDLVLFLPKLLYQ